MTDFILKTCVQLLAYLAEHMNEQDKSKLIHGFAAGLPFFLRCLGLAALFASLHWLRWW